MSTLTLNCNKNREHRQIELIYDYFVELKDRINQARLAAKLNKSELARRCSVDPSAINHLESGKTKTLSGSLLIKMSSVLCINPAYLETGKGTPELSASVTSISSEEQSRDPILDTLAELEKLRPYEAQAFRFEIQAAALRAKHEIHVPEPILVPKGKAA
ncbi:helix-turn-helix domain-containing protein [Propionivibrio sp.]|uniref:helix-turn-helix domain-containing protein n=1 Tax=Propionivibrio sp. TaxID=2212460 RepID=UPI003BF15FA7